MAVQPSLCQPLDGNPEDKFFREVWFGLVLLRFNVPVNNFSVMSGRSHRFLGIYSTFWEVNVSCSRTFLEKWHVRACSLNSMSSVSRDTACNMFCICSILFFSFCQISFVCSDEAMCDQVFDVENVRGICLLLSKCLQHLEMFS